jgi:polysaccharide biosynthesis/export protein
MSFQRIDKGSVLKGVLVFGCFLFSTQIVAQAQPPDSQTKPEDRARINDLVEVQVEDAPELSGSFPVRPDGAFIMPFLGRINAHLRTRKEIAITIEDSLSGRYLKYPTVSVEIRPGLGEQHAPNVATNLFYVAGEVNAPGSFRLEEGATLLQAITLAQGRTPRAANEVVIFRRDVNAGKRSAIRTDIGAITRGKRKDIVLRPGDIVIVPGRKKSTGEIIRRALRD